MCTYTNKTEIDTLARKNTNLHMYKYNKNTQMYKYTCANRRTLYTCTANMTTIYKQTEHIFTLTNNRMFELLVFTRSLENI